VAQPARSDPDGRRMRGRWAAARLLVGVGLLAAGSGTAVLAADRPGAVTVLGAERPVAAGARDPGDTRANNSPTLTRSPTDPGRLVVVNRVDLPAYSCALHESGDGGRTWRELPIPFPAGEELPERCFAPDAAFGADGGLHVVFATLKGLGNSPNAIWATSMAPGEAALSTPVKVLGRLSFQVRLAADPQVAGRLYLTWLRAEGVGLALFPETGNPIMMIRSEDGGRTWGEPSRVSPPSRARVVAPSPGVSDAGRLWVLYVDLGEDKLDYHGAHEWRAGAPYAGTWSLVLARSADGGRTWEETVVDDAVVPTQRFLVFLPQSPSLAVDRAGRHVYVGFSDGKLGDADVWVRSSDDGGVRFGPRRRVNDTVRRDGTWQYLPKLAVAPGGRLDVVYYDRRADRDNVMNGVSYQASFDRGRSFTPAQPLSGRTFDSRIGFGSRRGLPDLGSRLGLLAGGDRVLAVWTDTRAGTQANSKQDLALATVSVDEPVRRGGVRTLGWTAAAAGLVLAASSRRGRRRPGPGPEPPAGPAAADDDGPHPAP